MVVVIDKEGRTKGVTMVRREYSDMTNEELVAKIVELEDERRLAWVGTITVGGYLVEEGIHEGWWSCRGSQLPVREAMRLLVRNGHWELYPKCNFYARPIEKDVTAACSRAS